MKIDIQSRLNLLKSKADGSGTFVNFLIVTNPSYVETRFNNVNNKLGMDQKNTGLNFAGSVMKGKSIQSRSKVYKCTLNKPYENEVTSRGQIPPLKCCQDLEIFTVFEIGLDT